MISREKTENTTALVEPIYADKIREYQQQLQAESVRRTPSILPLTRVTTHQVAPSMTSSKKTQTQSVATFATVYAE